MVEKEKWAEEMCNTTVPPENIVCKDCVFRLQPITIAGETIQRYTYGNCKIYEGSELKPHDVLWNGNPCEFYEKDKHK